MSAHLSISSGVDPGTAHSRKGPSSIATPALDLEMWDRFVAASFGGDIVQTAAWAGAKEEAGWQCCRVVACRESGVLGGAQLLIRRFGPLAAIGYVPRGPLLAEPTSRSLAAKLLDDLERAARARRVWYLIVQPPEGGDVILEVLAARGYTVDAPNVAPLATLRIDLALDLDQILARMPKWRRREVRRAETRGVEVRFAAREDVATFHALYAATARRKGFRPLSRSYLELQWDALAARGLLLAMIAWHEGRPLAGQWLTVFAGTVTSRLAGWTGEGSNLLPNVAVQWAVIKWAKETGNRWYDLGGINRALAALLAAGSPLPLAATSSHAGFKAAFGAQPVLLPAACQIGLHPIARIAVGVLRSPIGRHPAAEAIISRFRDN